MVLSRCLPQRWLVAACLGVSVAALAAVDRPQLKPSPGRASCPVASAASAARVTSKLRHIPAESDACANSHGVARPARAASAEKTP